MNLVRYGSRDDILIPRDWQQAGIVQVIPGAASSGYEGAAVLCLTLDAVVLSSPRGIEEIVPLWSVEDVAVVKFDGVLIERETSVGMMLSPLPFPHGIEISYTLETRLRLRLRLVTMFANTAHQWANDIRRAARQAQLDGIQGSIIRRRSE